MSFRNLFLIKLKKDVNISIIYKHLSEYMLNSNFGICFEPQKYYDEILELLECDKNYFTLTEDKNHIECEAIFDCTDAYIYASSFLKREFKGREREYLYNKLSFIDELLNIIFGHECVEAVEVYISDQYSILLEDFSRVIKVENQRFTDALLVSYEPTKEDKYYGVKTTKFIIKR